HGAAVVVPVGVLSPDVPVQRDELLHRRVAGVGGDVRQFGVALGDGVGPAVLGADVRARPRVAGQVAGLGAVRGDRDADEPALRVEVVGDVGQLGPPVPLE